MKKLNKLFAILVAMAMVLSLAAVSAFAATEENTIAVTKKLNVANNMDPTKLAGEVVIHFDYKSATGSASETPASTKTKPITIENTTNIVAGTESTAYYYSTGVLDPVEFFELGTGKNPGVYTYDVYETVSTAITAEGTDEKNTGSDNLDPVKHYTLTILKGKDNSFTFSAKEDGANEKTIINPGQQPGDIQGNGLAFENNLFEDISGNNYESAPFKFKKVVQDDANIYNNESFAFTYTLALPEGATIADDVVAVKNVSGTEETFTPALGANTINLKDGDYVYFKKLPAGATVSALETATDVAAQAGTGAMYYCEDKGQQATMLPTAGLAEVVVTNISDKAGTTEGVLINSIPYIVLALVAIGGMVAYVVVRRRNADEA